MFDHISFDKNKFNKKGILPPDYSISSYGSVWVELIVRKYLDISIVGNDELGGWETEHGEIVGLDMRTPLTINPNGSSEFIISRIGDSEINFIELTDILVGPGETITIDTDLLIVLFGATHDVSAITDDSVFFELGPGSNGFSIFPEFSTTPTPGDDVFDVTVIWQNRWL